MKHIITHSITWLATRTLAKYDPIVIGITGSVGKTSTKEAVKVVLEKKYSVRATEKSYNNEIGLPLTILGFHSPGKNPLGWLKVMVSASMSLVTKRSYPEVLILEMGADHPGDIAKLVSCAPCDIGVVTKITDVGRGSRRLTWTTRRGGRSSSAVDAQSDERLPAGPSGEPRSPGVLP